MGVYHFMGVGRSVGAVTCAVDYIEKALDLASNKKGTQNCANLQKLFQGTGGISHDEVDKGKIEAIVLFTSREIIQSTETAYPYKECGEPGAVRAEIKKVLKKVWKRADHDVGRKLFWCEVDIDNYEDCFDKVIKIAYRFSPPGKQGKEIWCNLTSGTNPIQLALLSMSRLTAVSVKHYFISQSKDYRTSVEIPYNIKICPNKDRYFNIVPFLKFSIDTVSFYNVLKTLEECNHPIKTEKLLGFLKNQQSFTDCTLEVFKKQYMLKLYGLGYTEYSADDNTNKISDAGIEFLVDDLMELERKLSQAGTVADTKEWSWFTEEEIT